MLKALDCALHIGCGICVQCRKCDIQTVSVNGKVHMWCEVHIIVGGSEVVNTRDTAHMKVDCRHLN